MGALQTVTTQIISALLKTIDILREFMTNIEEIDKEGDVEFEPLIKELTSIVHGKQEEVQISKAVPIPLEDNSTIDEFLENAKQSISTDLNNSKPENNTTELSPTPKASLEPEMTPCTNQETSKKKKNSENYIQIDVNLLDSLVNLVGELVLSRNQILTYSANSLDHDFQHVCQVLSYVATQIQENVMKMRLQPVGLVWNKFNRIVRDLAIACDKKINLEMIGSETTLDKSLIDSIKDPLTHLIRNAVDHGIESPSERVSKGKKEAGLIKLKSYQENGQIIIEISDDGKGLQTERIKDKAISKGLVTQNELELMSHDSLLNLVFKPGFSTNDEVTNISGRGVGMDVVKSNIESIGGSVEISSIIEKGSTFKIQIPLTLAIIPTLIMKNSNFSFAVPQNNIIELVRVKSSVIEHILIPGNTFGHSVK